MATDPSGDARESNGIDLTGQYIAGRYQVVGLLGRGSMGYVYRALDQNLQTDVVLKIPSETRRKHVGFLQRFRQESKFLVQLRHPHIISILDVGQFDEVPFFVMQYVAGGALDTQLRGKQGKRRILSPRTLQKWLPQIAAALDFMHAQDCIHRDVKPANILFDRGGNPYLSDFGLSKILLTAEEDSSSTAAGAVIGTPNYVAPELVLGKEFDGSADQYSLAISVYETLTGVLPFEGATASATMVNQVRNRPQDPREINPRIPNELAEVILRGMSKRADRRYPSCSDFADACLEALNSSEASNSSESWLSSGATTISHDVPQFIPDARRKVKQGRVKCKGCETPLAIPSKLAGKKGRCGKCGQRMQVARNAKNVEFYVPLDPSLKPSASQDAEFAFVFSQKAFGYEFNAMQALSVVGVLLTLIIVGSVVATIFLQHDPDAAKANRVNQGQMIPREGG